MKHKIYIVGVGGIGVSAIARYYLHAGWQVAGSDLTQSTLTDTLAQEGVDILIGEDAQRVQEFFSDGDVKKLVYTEAISETQSEFIEAKNMGIETLSYPQALADIVNKKRLIAIAGTHGKSTTTSLTSLVLKDSDVGVNTIVGTLLKEFDGKNVYFSQSDNFVIEACEYKRSFLHYRPTVGVITNIELDHADYYSGIEDYVSAYESFVNNIVPGGFLILGGDDMNSRQLIGKRNDIHYIEVFDEVFLHNGQSFTYPKIDIKIPGKHILFDAKIAYIIGHMLGLEDREIQKKLSVYNGVWRRMERIGETVNNNILLSDYGHHPTEISLTLESIKKKYIDKKIVTIFQPHQYSRTIELLEGFKTSFVSTDILVIPDIYESRDSLKDKESMNAQILLDHIDHPGKVFGDGLENTAKWIQNYDTEHPDSCVIVLLGAGSVDDLRFQIEME